MIQAQWHTVSWQISPMKLIPLGGIDFTREIDIETTKDSEGQPPSQIVRVKNDKFKVDYNAVITGGSDPRYIFDMWYSYIGIHAPFYLNGWRLGEQDMLLLSVNTTSEYINSNGRIMAATYELEFEGWFTEGGLKSDLGRWATLTRGVVDYYGHESESALRVTASEIARQRGEEW